VREREPERPDAAPEAEDEEKSRTARYATVAALILAVIAVLLLLQSRDSYEVTARFANASQLVKGNDVEVAGTKAGTIDDISLAEDGTALVKMTISGDYAPLRAGTVATIRSQSLSGIANRYIQLQMPTAQEAGAPIKDGGILPISQTVSEIDLDQLFNTFDQKTIGHFKDVIKGFARAYDGVGPQTNKGFHYLNPFLSTSRQVFGELTADENRFRHLIVDTAGLSGALAERSPDLEQFVSNADTAFGALASQDQNLASAVGQLPGFMRNFNTTAVNLRAALDDLDPLVNASKPVAKKLQPFSQALRGFAVDAVPTVRRLDAVVRRPGADNDLTELTRLQPPLARIAVGPVKANGATRQGAFPASVKALNRGLPQLAFFRPYLTTEALSGWFDDFGHSGVVDANGGMGRISTTFNFFSASPGGLPNIFGAPLTPSQVEQDGFKTNNLARCPGSNERDPGDGSTPFTDNGNLDCDPGEVPSGP
jgi:phospholipid/cholesterol/gamma-HCH transport system substrate-binding protein